MAATHSYDRNMAALEKRLHFRSSNPTAGSTSRTHQVTRNLKIGASFGAGSLKIRAGETSLPFPELRLPTALRQFASGRYAASVGALVERFPNK
jgi:hypothetical protein